ncbi:hypothetical protein HNQ59_002080 [Chitinivorax tropicus]|uniref:Nuclear transport factor 2 family protein n=1 Tax=Chitinivorax tropicus TaxID=714531 RepID=A0A840MP49_9PROT|nr:hypothetical protein [Chitinivorax tropicus]MBB5018787.1 hypothetical protein [Chitinivorax tropicus]
MRVLPGILLCFSSLSWAQPVSPDGVVSELWQALSSLPGEKPAIQTLKQLFHPDAYVFGASYRQAEPTLTRSSALQFITMLDRPAKDGFHECEIFRDIQVFDRFATVYSVVESRTDKTAAKPDFTGVNSIQLYQTRQGWQIISLYYHVGQAGVRIPLKAGVSGQCLS